MTAASPVADAGGGGRGADGRSRRWWKGLSRRLRREPFLVAVSALALLYVAAGWSPSSYAVALRNLGVADDGLIFGRPQPIRSDEFAVWTPTLQAVVASDFGPVNRTSLYGEAFRTLSAQPLADWALVFKPQFWAFFVLSPARAYSAYHAFHGWALLVGWTLFLRRLGVDRVEAALASVVLFATPWAQTWWTSLAPVLVGAPWLLLAALADWRAGWRLAAVAYVAAAWLLDGLFYPPLVLVAGLTASLAVVAFRPESLGWRRLVVCGGGIALGVAVAALYLHQPILRAAGMQVFGSRAAAGGSVPWQNWWGTFLPAAPYVGWEAPYGTNACESSSGGHVVWLLALAFLRRPARRIDARALLARSAPLVALFLAATVWMLAPVPPLFGKPLLWHLMAPSRLLLVPGLVALLLALLWLPRIELRWSWSRAALVAAAVVGAWRLATPPGAAASLLGRLHRNSDLLLIPLVFLLPAIAALLRRAGAVDRQDGTRLSPAALLAVAAVANLAWFGHFNPVQASTAIFRPHESEHLRALEAMAAAHPRGWLVVGDSGAYFGSILNGLGFRSVNHALLAPDVGFFAEIFPELPPPRLAAVFDRYANVQVASRRPPEWTAPLTEPVVPAANAVLVPPEPFLPPLDVALASTAGPRRLPPPAARRRVELRVHPVDGFAAGTEVTVITDPPALRLLDARRLPVATGVEALGPDLYSLLAITLEVPATPELAWCAVVKGPTGIAEVGPLAGEGPSLCTVTRR